MRSPYVLAVAAFAAWAVDIGTKSWVVAALDDRALALFGNRLLLRESRNSGAAFSLFTGQTVALTVVTAAVLIAIAVYARRVVGTLPALAWGLVAGGAAGNLTDRLLRSPGPFRGWVVDWIDLGWFPSFNAADSAITVGAVLLVLLTLRAEPGPGPQASVQSSGPVGAPRL